MAESVNALALFDACPLLRGRKYASSLAAYRAAFTGETDQLSPRPMMPPPFLDPAQSQRGIPPTCSQPFLTTAVGSLPHGTPDGIDDLVNDYLVNGASRLPPNVDVDGAPQECSSNGAARRVIVAAALEGCELP